MTTIQELQALHPDKTVSPVPENWNREYKLLTLVEPIVTETTIEWYTLIQLTDEEKQEQIDLQKNVISNARRDLFRQLSALYERAYRQQRMGIPLTIEFNVLDEYGQALADITTQEGYPWNVVLPTFPG
jgi:protocatechuate 3,4-dioxygenase beta subunit